MALPFLGNRCSVSCMVAPYLADTSSDITYQIHSMPDPTLRVADHDIADGTSPKLDRLSIPANSELTAEVDGAAAWLGLAADEILLAALGRAIARTIGEGIVAVDVTGERRWLLHAIPLMCATAHEVGPTEMLGNVHEALAAAPGHGADVQSEIFLNYVGTVPAGTTPTYETPAGLGYALELRVYRVDGLLQLDWWYDTCRFDGYTIEELMEQFPFALFEMTSDAVAPV
jgi:hypothetical protein